LTAEPRIVADYDTKLPGWRIEAGRYRVAIGHDAEDRSMVATAELGAAVLKP
jgi:beta-glucosidase